MLEEKDSTRDIVQGEVIVFAVFSTCGGLGIDYLTHTHICSYISTRHTIPHYVQYR
jgi:hypothetical protein